MADLDALGLNDESMEIAHEFEVDLNCLVIVNHNLALEGITRSEDEELASLQPDFEHEETMLLMTNFVHTFYEDLRRAANNLAVVGLVNRQGDRTTA